MRRISRLALFLAALVAGAARADEPIVVTPDNFARAESDLRLSAVLRNAPPGAFQHQRAPTPIDRQTAARAERDVLVSTAVFDLDAGPVTITLPDPGKRFLSLQTIDEDGYTDAVAYDAGPHVLSKDKIGTRYVLAVLRIAARPDDDADLAQANALQDAATIAQPGGPGAFVIPNWDAPSQLDVRTGLRVLAETLNDSKRMFGPRGKVDPVRFLIGAATAWGGLPEADLMILDRTPQANDGQTVHRLELKGVPVDGLWSISVTNDRGFFVANPQKAYTLSGASAQPGPDGTVAIQFGGCDGAIPNCLPTPPNWALTVRLYRPRAEILSGAWTFPQPTPVAPAPVAVLPPPPVAPAAAAARAPAPVKPKTPPAKPKPRS